MRGALLAGVGLSLALAACASRKMSASAPPQSMAPADANVLGDDPRKEIEALAAQIADARGKLGFDPALAPAGTATPMTSGGAVPKSTDDTCKHGASEVCTDSCTLADSICDNAKKICDLAKKLPGDAWAAGKCDDADKSCSEAHGKCCGCQ